MHAIDKLTALPSGTRNFCAMREEFLAAADAANARVESYSVSMGLQGEVLAIDTAYVGPEYPRAVVITSSGVHGAEIDFPSQIQIDMLTGASGSIETPPWLGWLYIHGANPTGAYFLSRGTLPEGVDLNRNFVDHPSGHREPDPLFMEHFNAIHPKHMDLLAVARLGRSVLGCLIRYDWRELKLRFGPAQNTCENGVQFGGRAPTKENRILRQIFQDKVIQRGPKVIVLRDLHTGLVRSGAERGAFTCLADYTIESWQHETAQKWHGTAAESSYSEHSISVPLPGNLGDALHQEVQRAGLSAKVIAFTDECGLTDNFFAMWALWGDHWVHREENIDSWQAWLIKKMMRQAFAPPDRRLRGEAIRNGIGLHVETISGLVRLNKA